MRSFRRCNFSRLQWCRDKNATFRSQFSASASMKMSSLVEVQTWRAEEMSEHAYNVHRATLLLRELLKRTRNLMGNKLSADHLIAFSGGVDSSLVAAVVHRSKRDKEVVKAVLGISYAVPKDQIDQARSVAEHIGIELTEIPTDEGTDEVYIENEGRACFACKTHLYSTLKSIVSHATTSAGISRLYNGTNADDMRDPTRLGLVAADDFSVLSPLTDLTKEDVRLVARHLGLPNWNHAASPCLRSRLALGVKAIPDHLKRVEKGESYVRNRMAGFIDERTNLRVRLFSRDRACIEIDEEILGVAMKKPWDEFFVNELNFSSVEVRPFRSGSVSTPQGSKI